MQGTHFIQDLAVILLLAGAVGWVCQRLGLSVVVGFLAAGVLVGPSSPLEPLVQDVSDIHIFAQIGLIFLMFSIGLKLSLRRLRRMGFALALATAIGALGVYATTRVFAAFLGWSWEEGLFLAGMLMVSSSSIISKILQEAGINHERHGQIAIGVSVLEDIVAVVMLTLLNSIVQLDGRGAHAGSGGVIATLILLAVFVTFIGILGLLVVPWLLRRMSVVAGEEIQTVGLAALLFGLSLVAERAGYSIAMGAFLLGIIIAETPHRHQVERTFEGMRDVFTAVFFVAMGLQIDARDLLHNVWLIVGISAFTLVARPLCIACGVSLIGIPAKEALKAGLMVSPIGEFSFIIAQMGVAAEVVDRRFFPLAVGVSLLTTLATPILVRYSVPITASLRRREPNWLNAWLESYHGWLESVRGQQKRNILWQLCRKRLWQVSTGVLFVSGLLIFSRQLLDGLTDYLRHDLRVVPTGLETGFWIALCLLALIPVVAIWRNCSAMTLLFAQVMTANNPRAKQITPAIEAGLKSLVAVLLCIWLISIAPAADMSRWILIAGALVALVLIFLFRRKLIYWHSVAEVGLQNVIETGEHRASASSPPWLQPHNDWNLHMIECAIPDMADAQGKSLKELALRSRFGCSVVGIERQGYMIPLPTAEAVLYPRDKVLLLGTVDQVNAGRDFLGAVSGSPPFDSLFEEIRMEAVLIPEASRATGRTLGELSPARDHGVQVAGINRGGVRILNPSASETVQANDQLLVLGASAQIAEFRAWASDIAGA